MKLFKDLKDGEQFAIGETVYWKTNESDLYNAVECENSNIGTLIPDNCEVELEYE